MLKHILLISAVLFAFGFYAQEIKKENLSKQQQTYWDFNKTQIQSRGKNYVDQFGETKEKHGKWVYYDKLGEIEEVRNYYRDMLYGSVILYYPNGTKRQEGFFKYDRQDSLYTEWYETGHVKVEGEYNQGEPVKSWKYYYRDGRLKSVEEVKGDDNYLWEFYLPDSLHTQIIKEGNGELVTYYTTGKVKEWYNYENGLKNGPFEELSIYNYPTLKGEFKNGLKHGTWEYFYYTGDKEKTSNYVDGVLDGDYQYFYDNGKVTVDGQYKNGEKEGEWSWFTNVGTPDMKGTFKNSKQHGDWSYWHPTGELSYTAHFTDGIKTGTWTYFYKNGTKFKEGPFENDLKHGEWKTWYEDETLLMEGKYENGKEEGVWINYWENGKIKNKATFKAGQLEGEWLSFYPNGKPKLTGKYEADMKVGEWLEYFDNGKPKDLITYKLFKRKSKVDYGIMKDRVTLDSKMNGPAVSYSDKDFKKTEEGAYKEGLKDGEWIAYYPGGKNPAVVSQYKNGELHGTMKQYSRRGELLSEIDYKDGLKHGRFIIYGKKGEVVNERQYEHGMQIIEGQTNDPGTFTPGR